MMEAFEIVLDDNAANVYHQGENLTGHVKILLAGHKKITELSVTFRGEASTYTSWLHKRGTSLTADQCGASETYFEDDTTIINNETYLKTGVYIFPFKFAIPSHQNLPSSFEGDHGHVKYFVSARLNSYLYAKKIFTMVGGQAEILDMDSLLTSMAPVSSSGEKLVPRLCCFSGRVTVFGQTDKKAYIPGENIIICGSIINHSHRHINHLCTRLIQKALYANCSEFPTGESQRVLVEEMHELFCDRSSSMPFSNKLLTIPSCAPSGLPGCDVIDVKYFVYIESEACVWLPIDIGVSGKIGTTVHDPSDGKQSEEPSTNYKQGNRDATPYVNSSPGNTLAKPKTPPIVLRERETPTPSERHSRAQLRKSIPSIVMTSKDDRMLLLNRPCHKSMMETSGDYAWPDLPDLSNQLHIQTIPMTLLNKSLNQNTNASSLLGMYRSLDDIDASCQSKDGSPDTTAYVPLEDANIPILPPPAGFTDQLTPVKEEEEEISVNSSCSSILPTEENLQNDKCQTVVAEEFSFLSADYF